MFGLELSTLTGKEPVYSAQIQQRTLQKYSFEKYIKTVKDQGQTPMCVPFSISQIVEWYWRTSGMKNPQMDKSGFYAQRAIKNSNGMSFKEALELMMNKGYVMDKIHTERIYGYCRIPSKLLMQDYLVAYAPFLLGVPVYDSTTTEFWKPSGTMEGYHAVVAVGFDDFGLRILNSWGTSYGEGGFANLPWEDLELVKEAWGITF
jgi:hypothetical protein